jgi:eukaryotic translation initiation factor 2C
MEAGRRGTSTGPCARPAGSRQHALEPLVRLVEDGVGRGHRRTNQKYTVQGLTPLPASQMAFVDTKSRQTKCLMEYYAQKHGIVIEYQMLPCLDLSKSKDKPNHVPIELCTLLEGQRFPKANLDKNSGRILKGKALIPASNRRNEILDLVSASDGPCM